MDLEIPGHLLEGSSGIIGRALGVPLKRARFTSQAGTPMAAALGVIGAANPLGDEPPVEHGSRETTFVPNELPGDSMEPTDFP